MRTFKEYTNDRDMEDMDAPGKPAYKASMGQMGTAMNRFGAAWDKQVNRDPDKFRNTFVSNRNRLKAGVAGNLDPYLNLARNRGEVNNTVSTMKNTLGRLQKNALARVNNQQQQEPVE